MKTLVIGCSFSMGSQRAKLDRDAVETLLGWYNYIGYNDLVVYGLGAHGYLTYSEVIKTLDLTEYNQCIIQETFEPRIHFPKRLYFKKQNLAGMTHYTGQGLKNIEHSVPYIRSSTGTHIAEIAKCYIENKLREFNIPCYTVSYGDQIAGLGYATHLCNNLYQLALEQKDPGLFSYDPFENSNRWPHLSLDGNKFIGNYIKGKLNG